MVAINYQWYGTNLLEEADDVGNATARYTVEPDTYGNVISQRRGGDTNHFLYDGLGSTMEVVDLTGAVTDTRRYTAFGETIQETGTTEFPVQYVGRKGYYFDEERDTYYVRRRDYSPHVARWRSVDVLYMHTSFMTPPYLMAGITVAQRPIAPYLYCLNSPVYNTDPSGMLTQKELDIIAGRLNTCKEAKELLEKVREYYRKRPDWKLPPGKKEFPPYFGVGDFNESTFGTGEISINKKETFDCRAIETMLFEMSNLLSREAFLAIALTMCDKSRDEFIRAAEEWEFASAKSTAKIWKTCKDTWRCPDDCPTFGKPDRVLAIDFDEWFKKIKPGHKENWGRFWDQQCKKK